MSLNACVFPGTEIISSQLLLHVESVVQTLIFLAQNSQDITDFTSRRRESLHFLTPFEITFVHLQMQLHWLRRRKLLNISQKKKKKSCSYKVILKLNDSEMFYILYTSDDDHYRTLHEKIKGLICIFLNKEEELSVGF